MYKAIIDTFTEKIVPNENIDGLIPAGTSIQNFRTTQIGDILTCDGHHLSYSYGQYTASLAWCAALTGGEIDIIKWYPEKYPEIVENLDLIKASVKSAMANPFEVTSQAK